MIYQSSNPSNMTSRVQPRRFQSTTSKLAQTGKLKRDGEKCRGRCRVQWSEKHVKEGLVLVQESQLARVVKTGPIAEHYDIDSKPFASGQWAKVYRCRSRSTGIIYAAKYSSRTRFNADCSAELRHEIALLSLCSQSARVVKLHDVYETPKEIILVMEFAPGGDLQTLIDGDLVPLEGDVVHFVKQLVEGLAYLHERNIAHLDIKPQNLVMMGSFPECDVKLCDFEISRVILEGTEIREILGTPDYVAPEILHYEPITLAADMWSLGVTTYVLLTGFSPFGGESDQETFQNISLGEVDFPEELFEDISAQAKDFVSKLLVLDPSARMSAKQCLRHDWLRDAPTQASPHLRKYLSKSREVLLERVVTRDNQRRVANNVTEEEQINLGGFSQSEICLHYSNGGSNEYFMSPANSQTSLNSSQTSLGLSTSQASLLTSQSYLLNKEQTQGLLNQAQSRSQANLNHVTCRGLLSRMRSLNQIQSQACLLTGKSHLLKEHLNPLFGSQSQEKLYGIKCLSKSQGVLDIYTSLESIKKIKRITKKDVLPSFNHQQFSQGINMTGSVGSIQTSFESNRVFRGGSLETVLPTDGKVGNLKDDKEPQQKTEENLDSLQSVESDTLTEDSDETPLRLSCGQKQPSKRQNSDTSSHSNNSGNSDDKEEHSESENDEPKYTVAQLVSAFNKHQEVASKTSVEAIMTEKRINEVTFPTGPKALRLFIPDINISERGVVRRKTSYKPRKNWEELRKKNEKNEGVLKDLNDSGNEEDSGKRVDWSGNEEHRDTRIDEKYKQCVESVKMVKEQKERMPNYIYPEVMPSPLEGDSKYTFKNQGKNDNSVNLKDILQREDDSPKKNLEKLRKRTSITKIIINDHLPEDSNNNSSIKSPNRAKSEPPSDEKSEIGNFSRSTSVSSETPTSPVSITNLEDHGKDPEAKIKSKRELGKGESKRTVDEQKNWGRVCTGSYFRALEKFNGKNIDGKKKSLVNERDKVGRKIRS